MARAEHGHPELRASVPTLEPDEAFLARLSELAAGSGASRPPAGVPSLPGWRVGLAAASVVAVVGGLAWLAAAVSGDESPPPPVTPVTQPTDSGPSESDQDLPTGGNDAGVESDETAGPGGSSDPGGAPGSRVGSAPGGGSDPQVEVEGPSDDEQGAPGEQGQGNNGQDHGQARAGPRAGRAGPRAGRAGPRAAGRPRRRGTRAGRAATRAGRAGPRQHERRRRRLRVVGER